MKEKKTILRFTGEKYKLHKKLKMWCLLADKTLNGTIISLIEEHLKENNK